MNDGRMEPEMDQWNGDSSAVMRESLWPIGVNKEAVPKDKALDSLVCIDSNLYMWS